MNMAQLTEAFDHNVVPADGGYDPVPPGTYMLMITDSDYTSTKNGNGKVLKLTSQIVDGEYQGRNVFENLCLEHENPKTVQIAKAKFSALCKALRITSAVKDSSELHNKTYFVNLGIEEGSQGYADKNVIKKYIFDKPEINSETITAKDSQSPSNAHGTKPAKSAAWNN
jgi:hypothetical protein